MARRRAGRAHDQRSTTTAARTACSGSASRRPSRVARRSPRSATPSSAGRSGVPTSMSPRSRSPSTIPPTTGSPSGPRPGSRIGDRRRRDDRDSGLAGDRRRRGRRPRRSSPGSARCASLVIALVRQGVTSTLSRHDGSRYGVLHIDSNLPDVRLAVGGPGENRFVGGRPRRRRSRLPRRTRTTAGDQGWARLVGARGWRRRVNAPSRSPTCAARATCRSSSSPGADPDATTRALEALVADLEDGVISVEQPAELDGATGECGGLHARDPEPGHAELQRRGRRQPVPLAHAVVQRLAIGRLDRPATAGDA